LYLVDGVLLPVLDVDDADAAHEQLQLALVEDLDVVQRNKLAETGQEVVHLFRITKTVKFKFLLGKSNLN
jgi:hypothetical protein